MNAQENHPSEEVTRLQRCMNDLLSMMALPAIWRGGDSPQIARTLIDVLQRMLRLDLIYVQLKDLAGNINVEMARVDDLFTCQPSEIGAQLNRLWGGDPHASPSKMQGRFGDMNLSIAPVQLGLRGEIGMLVAGAARADFPGQTEELLLGVAANQAVIALHESRLRTEQKQLADELDQRVAQRTRELADSLEKWKQSQEILRNTQAELANMTRVMTMGQLTASIAHEVNQPLSGIITNASTCVRMLDANPPNIEGARETARRTIRDGNRASEVITRLRALFSKRQATTELFDLNEAAQEVIALVHDKLQRHQVTLQSEFSEDLPLIKGDRVQLQQVIMNLLQNASDAMLDAQGRPRQVTIQTQCDEADHVRLTVQDNGIGVDPNIVGRLFDPFYTTKSDGMGIGLAVSRSIIESHEGRIWAEPNDGPGATFAFSIPRNLESADDGQPTGSAEEPVPSRPTANARNL